MTYIKKIQHFALTSRPYSYIGEIARGIFFGLMLNSANPQGTIFLSSALTFLMWLYFNWQSDFIQRDNKGRIPPSLIMVIAPLAIAILICIATWSLWGIIGILIYSLTIVLYSYKAKVKTLGLFGPFFRVLTILGHFTMLALFFKQLPDATLVAILIFIATFKGLRNLVGDLRDIQTDKWEIPVQLGAPVTFHILRIGFTFLLFDSFFIMQNDINFGFVSFLFASFCWVFLEWLKSHYKTSNAEIGYIGHRFLIFFISAYLVIIAYIAGLPMTGTLCLLFMLFLFQWSYNLLPGKKYPSFHV